MVKATTTSFALLFGLFFAACGGGGGGSDGGDVGDAGASDGATRDGSVLTDGAVDSGDAGSVDAFVPPSECTHGIDHDGDDYTDWQNDPGCFGPGDSTEAALPRDQEHGFTTFDVGSDSVVVYVSQDGDDSADGLSPETAVQTLTHAASLLRDGHGDFMLLKRGHTWRGESLGRFLSGQDAAHPMVISSYGDSMELPPVELDGNFIDHNGQACSFVSVVGLHFVVYPKDPADAAFDGATDGGFRYVGGGSADSSAWFCLNGSAAALSDWQSASGEADATALPSPPSFTAPDRSVETYAGSIGVGSTLPDFLAAARLQSRLNWRDDLTALAPNDYIRAGFE